MADSRSLEGLHYVVTGGAGALGAAVARSLAERGAQVVILDRVPPAAREHGGIDTRVVDLADEHAVGAAFAGLMRLDGSIHCAGGFDMKPIVETTLTDFEAMWRINAVSCFLACRDAVRAMRRTRADGGRGDSDASERRGAAMSTARRGWIVNVAARPALSPVGGMIAYSASKAAVANLTQSLAAELLGEGILVNAVVPSIMDTPANRRAIPGADHSKWPSVDDVASVILALASPRNRITSGALIPVYGTA